MKRKRADSPTGSLPPPKRRKKIPSPTSPVPSSDPTSDSDATSFEDLGLHPLLLEGIRQRGYAVPRPIQATMIPAVLSNRDVVAQSKNGTGKSVAIAMVALNTIFASGDVCSGDAPPRLHVLVLAPTRELVSQLRYEALSLSRHCPEISIETFVGGRGENDDAERFRRGCHIAIGTTGRIGKLMLRYAVPLDDLRLLILDEADYLFSDMLADQVRGVFRKISQNDSSLRLQKVAMSATFDRYTRIEIQGLMSDPKFITLTEGGFSERNLQIDAIQEHFVQVPSCENVIELFQSKKRLLVSLLRQLTFQQCIVFCATTARCINVAKLLRGNGFPSDYISGQVPKKQRQRTVRRMRRFHTRICVATDIFSRGIDLSRVNVIVSFDLPDDSNTYMHRMGRTGRSGALGLAVSFVQANETSLFEYLRRKCTTIALPLVPGSTVSVESYWDQAVSSDDLKKWHYFVEKQKAHVEKSGLGVVLNDADFLLPKLRRMQEEQAQRAESEVVDEEDERVDDVTPTVRIQAKLSTFVNLLRDSYLQ